MTSPPSNSPNAPGRSAQRPRRAGTPFATNLFDEPMLDLALRLAQRRATGWLTIDSPDGRPVRLAILAGRVHSVDGARDERLALQRALAPFSWEGGSARFEPDNGAVSSPPLVTLDAPTFIRSGVASGYDLRRLQRELLPFEGIGLALGTPVAGSPPPTPEAQALLDLCDGTRDPFEVAAEASEVAREDVGVDERSLGALRAVFLLVRTRAVEGRWKPTAPSFRQRLERLSTLDYYGVLGVSPAARAEDIDRAARRMEQRLLPVDADGPESPELERLRCETLGLVRRARQVLFEPEARQLYERALIAAEARVDPVDLPARAAARAHVDDDGAQAARQRAVLEYDARAASARRDYLSADTTWRELAKRFPEEWDYQIEAGWSFYLANAPDPASANLEAHRDVAARAAAVIEPALLVARNRARGHFYLGHIARFGGDNKDAAAQYLKALEADPQLADARALVESLTGEHRVEVDTVAAAERAAAEAPVAEAGSAWRAVLMYCLVVGLCFLLGNGLGLSEGELANDPNHRFFWLRRGLLVAGALFGHFVFEGRRLRDFGWKLPGQWAALAALAGVIMGFLSPSGYPSGSVLVAVGMALTTVFAEELFFRAYLGRLVREDVFGEALGVFVAGLAYTIYHLTFFDLWNGFSLGWSLYYAALIGVGSGVPYAWLYFRSGSVLTPMICHAIALAIALLRASGAVDPTIPIEVAR